MRTPKFLRQSDVPLLAVLRQNANAQLADVAHAVGMPISTVHDRMKVIRERLIKRQVTHVHFPQLGYLLRCFTTIKVAAADRQALREHLQYHQNTNTLLHVNNGHDFLVETYFPTVGDFEKFLLKLSEQFRIREAKALYVIDEIVAEQFLSNPETVQDLQIRIP